MILILLCYHIIAALRVSTSRHPVAMRSVLLYMSKLLRQFKAAKLHVPIALRSSSDQRCPEGRDERFKAAHDAVLPEVLLLLFPRKSCVARAEGTS